MSKRQSPEPGDHALSSEAIRRLLESTRIVPWEADAKSWLFTYVGPQAVELLGYPVDAWYEQDFWADHIHPDDRDSALKLCLQSSQACEDYEFEYRMLAADGRVVWIQDLVSVEAVDGAPTILRGFLIDITTQKHLETERQTSEERFRRLIELAPDAIIAARSDGRIALANRAAERLFGYSQVELLDGISVEDLIPERFRAAHVGHRQNYLREPVAKQMGDRQSQLIGRHKNGNELAVDITIAPFPAGDETLIVAAIRDMTEQRQLETEIVRQREALARVARVTFLGEMQAAVAHELNQPLTAILSNAQAAMRFLDREPPDVSELKETLTDIIATDRRASNVIKGLHAMMAQRTPKRERISVNEQIETTLNLLRSDLISKGVSIQLDLDPTVPAVISDPVQVQQVFLNLFRNGVEAMADLSPGAKAMNVMSERDQSEVVVSFRDTGSGIETSLGDKLFDSFQTTRPGGLGMGLAICRRIVEAHGGKIWLHETSSSGSTFKCALPIAGDEAP